MNPRQLGVLKWVVAGCPDGVMTGTTYKTTAVALQGRRLIEISRKGGIWRATATPAGRYFAEHGAYPESHWAAASTGRSTVPGHTRPRREASASTPAHLSNVTSPKTNPKANPALRPVDQMMADLVEAGGTLKVSAPQSGYWERLASSAARYCKVPEGQLVRVERGATWDERVLRLVDKPTWMTAVLERVPVSQHLHKPHPVVARLRDDKDRLKMNTVVRLRALRILDALAKEAAARGHQVAAPVPASGYHHARGHLKITVMVADEERDTTDSELEVVADSPRPHQQRVHEHPYTLVLNESNDRVPHVPTATELRDKERYSWKNIPSHDRVPSGRLRIKVIEGWKVRQETFADTKTTDLTERLAEVLQEVELRADAAGRLRRQREEEAGQHRHQWEQMRDEAVVQVREQHRARVLLGQVDAWRRARELDDYLVAMTELVAAQSPGARGEAADWLQWAKAYRERLDPLGTPLRMPADPAITPEVLKPFMRGLSPYGP